MPVQGGPPQIVRSAQGSLLPRDTAPERSGQSSRWEAGLSRVSGTGSASTAGAVWKRKRRSPEVFKSDELQPSLDDVKKEHVSNRATTSKFSDKFCPCCGDVVNGRRPNAIFCCSRCLEQFHRDRKSVAVPIKRRPKRRRLL
jgi:hypothetical protein